MKIHHAQKHGKKLPKGEEYTCEWCGDSFRALPSTTHRFCGMECKDDAHSEAMSGESHPSYTGGTALYCKQCGEQYKVKPSVSDESSFCSRSCQWDWQRENWQEEAHPAAKEWYDIECEWCGEQFHVNQSSKDSRRFCSYNCRGEYQSEYIKGENHPQFDSDSHLNFGPNWDEQAEKCRERDDYTCQGCGLPQEEHFRALTGHHIRPRKEFIDSDGNYDYEEANRLENLVALCSACHQKYEGLYLKPQLV